MLRTTVYILKLAEGKWYVGKSVDPVKRYLQHLEGRGAAWTRRYPPLALRWTFPDVSPFEEDKKTKEMMSIFGIENVRGGAYVTNTLAAEQVRSLKKELWGSLDRCMRCGGAGHFAAKCPMPQA